MKQTDWLECGYILDGKGGAKKITPALLEKWTPKKGTLWLHLNLKQTKTIEWLNTKAGLPEWVAQTLTDTQESRPRTVIQLDLLLLVLRTINLRQRSEPDDMVFMRLFSTKNRLITVHIEPVLKIDKIQDSFALKNGPRNINELIGVILNTSLSNVSLVIDDIEDELDELEEHIIDHKITSKMPDKLSEILRKAVVMRRFLTPERDALDTLSHNKTKWFNKDMTHITREADHRLDRIIEDIDLIREKVRINQEALQSQEDKANQKHMYLLSLIATIFLPLTFITGLFGMNVGGIPFSTHPVGLSVITGIILLLGVLILLFFKKAKWI